MELGEGIVRDLKEVIEKSTVVQIGEKRFSPLEMKPIIDKNQITSLKICTLTGLVDYVDNNIDEADLKKCILVIVNPETVSLVSTASKESKLRDAFIEASIALSNSDYGRKYESGFQTFPFGSFLEQEEFIIKLRSLVADSPERNSLIEYVSKLSIKNENDLHDDGISQTATIKRGMSGAIKDGAKAPSLVKLSPWRTFREIAQPESEFLFRMKRGGDYAGPSCALIEADGGQWRNSARDSIKKFLVEKIGGKVAILA